MAANANGARTGRSRPTSADVAARAGVSRATVSYVLNDRSGHAISEPTRERVRRAARELEYVPNHSAKALRGQAPPVILVVTRGLPFGRNVGTIIDGLMAEAAAAQCSVLSWQWGGPADLERTLAHVAPRAVLSLVPLDAADQEVIRRHGIPVLSSAALLGMAESGRRTGMLQVQHLAARGCTRIARLGAAEEVLGMFEDARRAGAEAACAQLGIADAGTARIPMPTDADQEQIAHLVAGWTSGADPADGVACYNDFWAIAVLRAAARAGIAVPEQLAVIGVDDEPFAAFTTPSLSTVSLEPLTVGRDLLRTALALVGGAGGDAGTRADGDGLGDRATGGMSPGALRLIVRESA